MSSAEPSRDPRKLTDLQLIEALARINTKTDTLEIASLTAFERRFAADVPTVWSRSGTFSWKQRRIAREIVSKVLEELTRRKLLAEWNADDATG